jgi:hypothetical protein
MEFELFQVVVYRSKNLKYNTIRQAGQTEGPPRAVWVTFVLS